jgi:hypothetical protein
VVDGEPEDWTTREISNAFKFHRHWSNGHRLTADCIANEPATLIDAIEHVAGMLAWCEREAAEKAKQEMQQAQSKAKAQQLTRR